MASSDQVNPSDETTKKIIKDEDGNEITFTGKLVSGILLILLTALSIVIIIGYWPDRLPAPKESIKPLYRNKIFHVSLVGIPDSARMRYDDENVGTVAEKTGIVPHDTTRNKADSTDTGIGRIDSTKSKDSINQNQASAETSNNKYPPESKLIHINTILLILVAAGGFLGNIIYISTSFTTFIGAGKFKKSWTLWYCIKPFTAAGLALTIYFVFRGGFLNMSDNSTNINIYGVLTISLLAGLFTDRTTLKLKEVFDVLLKPKEERPDSLERDEIKITDIQPKEIEPGKVNTITLKGKNLDKEDITVLIEEQKITDLQKSGEEIKLSYTIPEEHKTKTELKIIVTQKDKEIYKSTLKIKGN